MSTAELLGARKPQSPAGIAAGLAIVSGLALLGFAFTRFLAVALRAVRYPYELDYGEGIVWQQMRLMFSGKAYASVNGYPGIVFHYPPVYHSTVEALAASTGMDPVAAGRVVSLSATLLCSLIIGAIAFWLASRASGRRVAAVCGAFAALACFTLLPVTYWATVMRVDMLAIFFSLAGLCFGLGALARPGHIYAAAACFIAAVFTKQIAIAAPAAVFVTLLLVRPAVAWRGIVACFAGGSIVLAALTFATNGGILRHLFLYNVNRFAPSGLELIPAVMLDHALFFSAVGAGLLLFAGPLLAPYRREPSWSARRARLSAITDDAAVVMVICYLAATTMIALLVAKSGANINYLVEWLLAGSIFAGLAVRDAAAQAIGPRSREVSAFSILLPAALGAQALATGMHAGWQLETREQRRSQLDQLAAMIRAAPRPVISDDMVLLQRGGKNVVIEPAIFAELTGTGRWDERPFIQHILSRDFSFFITEGDRGMREFDSRYTPRVASAMDEAYPARCVLGGYVIHFPGRMQGSPRALSAPAEHGRTKCTAKVTRT